MALNAPHNSPIPIELRRDRTHRTWRWWLGWGSIGLAVLLVGGYFVFHRLQNSRVAHLHAHLDATAFPWRFEDLCKEGEVIPDEENSAIFAAQIEKKYRLGDVPDPYGTLDLIPTLDPEKNDELREWMHANRELLQEAIRLKDFTRGRFPVSTEWIEETRFLRIRPVWKVMMAVRMAALGHAEGQEGTEACTHLRAFLKTTRIYRQEYDVMVGPAVHHMEIFMQTVEAVLAKSDPSEASLADLQATVTPLVDDDLREFFFRSHRAFMAKIYEAYCNGSLRNQMIRKGGGSIEVAVHDFVPSAYFHQNYAEYMEWLEREKAKNRHTLAEVFLDPAKQSENYSQSLNVVGKLMAPKFQVIPSQAAKYLASVRITVAALAAERYRLKHGDWPTSIDDLVKEKLLPNVLEDPYDGKPLRFRRMENELRVYSIGGNLADDQGKLYDPVTFSPNYDTVFRLFDPTHRRQQAPPKTK